MVIGGYDENAVRIVLATGLQLLGIAAPQSM
jgi:arginyl-tRNA synthetase